MADDRSSTLGAPAGRLRLRAVLAFVAVALAAVAVTAGLTAGFTAAEIPGLESRQRGELAAAIAVAAGAAKGRSGGWAAADLAPVLDLASRVGADAQIRDASGRAVASTPGFATRAGPRSRSPVMVHGRRVGQVEVRFSGTGVIGRAAHRLQAWLWNAIAVAAGLAGLLALGTGLLAARLITRPVGQLIEVARAMGQGDRAARAGAIRAPGELRELARTFDQMADSLDRDDQLRRNLVEDVAHELRTPMAVLQAGHEALLDGVAAPTPGQLASLRAEVGQLARLVGDLQALAVARTTALRFEFVLCDLSRVAGESADSLRERFEAAGVHMRRHLAPAQVLADPQRLRQLIVNLLTNALKFTPAGGHVTVSSGIAGAGARVRVSDTGIGIPASEMPRIFDRSWRGRLASRVPGHGIGLAVAAELAHAHGGSLEASSTPGGGTQVTLTLPRR